MTEPTVKPVSLRKQERSLKRDQMAKGLSCSMKGLSLTELELIKEHRSATKWLLKGQELRLEVHPRPF